MRKLADHERKLIELFAANLYESLRVKLLSDLNCAIVEKESADGSRLCFELRGYKRPSYLGQRLYPVEGELQSRDGSRVSVLLYADKNDRLLELEFIGWSDNIDIDTGWATLRIW
jgi:hypothetical protein